MQRSLARKLIALLLLLALIAGGDRFAAVAITMDESGAHMTDMQKPDMSCKACGGTMAAAPCDALCAALPAIDVAVIGLSDDGSHEQWVAHSESGATYSIRPDTSPPRASLS